MALIAVLVVSALAITTIAGVFVVRRQMESAADLAALAGAEALQRGGDACAAATETARRNRAHLSSCEVLARDVRITVESRRDGLLGRFDVPARARAGPAA